MPVDRRWADLDRTTTKPGLVVLIWAVVMIAVMPGERVGQPTADTRTAVP